MIFVDDGSRDGTADMLGDLAARLPGRADVLKLGRNQGKGEAVRQGLIQALALEATVVGYVDADMATPVPEICRLMHILEEHGLAAVLGARLAILGHVIDRSPVRHYLGRVFATGASLVLGLPIYDTQCGAKFFRVSPMMRGVLDDPFASRWAFDVELIGRIIQDMDGAAHGAASPVKEVPLRNWRDRGRSKIRPAAMIVAFLSLLRINHPLRSRRRAKSP